MPAPLTNDQKRILSQLARRAWAKLGPELDGQDEASFRHDAVARACGKLGLRCCSQDDYGAVKAHFLDILGESGRAMNALVHQEGNARRIAQHKLMAALRDARLQLGYAAAICRNQFRCELDDASAKQLWCLTFTIKNRARKVTIAKEVYA